MPFFDTAPQGATGLVHALREEASQLQEALSDKLGAFVQGLACFVGGMVGAGRACLGNLHLLGASMGWFHSAWAHKNLRCWAWAAA